MKIVVIGANGTIGQAVCNLLAEEHQVIRASRYSELAVDLQKPDTLENIFDQHPNVDAVICVAGRSAFGQLDSLNDEAINLGINNKLMGQVNLVRIARRKMKENGIVILTTGMLSQYPNLYSSMATMINRGLEGFVEAVSLDMPKNQKIHAVSPPMAKETVDKLGRVQGGVPVVEIAKLYKEALTSTQQGKIFSYSQPG
jgi:NAD(P)-dependent dehydrogenase (short-subunit alcohol dehydrogenase family)